MSHDTSLNNIDDSDSDSDSDNNPTKQEIEPPTMSEINKMFKEKNPRSSNIMNAIFLGLCCAALTYFSVWLTFYPEEKDNKLTSLIFGICLWIMSFLLLCLTCAYIYAALFDSIEHVKIRGLTLKQHRNADSIQ